MKSDSPRADVCSLLWRDRHIHSGAGPAGAALRGGGGANQRAVGRRASRVHERRELHRDALARVDEYRLPTRRPTARARQAG